MNRRDFVRKVAVAGSALAVAPTALVLAETVTSAAEVLPAASVISGVSFYDYDDAVRIMAKHLADVIDNEIVSLYLAGQQEC